MVQKKRSLKIVRISIGVILLVVIAFFAGRYFLYFKIRQTIENELASLKEQEIFVDYDHIEVHPWQGKLEFIQLRVSIRKDNLENDGLDATIPYVLIKGVDLIPFLMHKTLSLHRVSAQQASITYAQGATLFQYDSTKQRRIELKNISIQHVDFPGIDLYVRDKQAQDTLAHLLTHVSMENIFLHKQLDSMTWQRGEIFLSDVALNMYKEKYGFSVKRIHLGLKERMISVDSFAVKPVLDRNAFMQYKGKEDTYVDGVVPSLEIEGVDWFVYPKPAISADRITTTFFLSLYRDKRLPFLEKNDKDLPSHMLQRLPFELVIDTFLIRKSYLKYIEHPEEGDSAGSVFFDDLYATIHKVHNNPKVKTDIRMTARTSFMGTGELNADFTFPYDTTRAYLVSGTLENMPLMNVNAMLGPAAKARIESGTMKKLSFHFSYTPLKSKGEVELNYEDLKIQTLRSNSKDEQKVSKIKTLLLNTFIIKKDMDEDIDRDKRTGEINFYRDTKRSVFNYWWKSILSGLKAAYNLDKLPIGKSNVKDKKDEEAKKKKKGIKEIISKIF